MAVHSADFHFRLDAKQMVVPYWLEAADRDGTDSWFFPLLLCDVCLSFPGAQAWHIGFCFMLYV